MRGRRNPAPQERSGGAGCGGGTEPAPAQPARPAVNIGHGSVEDVIEALAARGLPCTGPVPAAKDDYEQGDDAHDRAPPVTPVHFFSKEQAAAYERTQRREGVPGVYSAKWGARVPGAAARAGSDVAPHPVSAARAGTGLAPTRASVRQEQARFREAAPRRRRGDTDTPAVASQTWPTLLSRDSRAPRPPVAAQCKTHVAGR